MKTLFNGNDMGDWGRFLFKNKTCRGASCLGGGGTPIEMVREDHYSHENKNKIIKPKRHDEGRGEGRHS